MVESLDNLQGLSIENTDEIFKTILASLPNSITVYPTEGYYYFWFYHKGNQVRGNLRFAYDHRDKGELPLAYYYDIAGQESKWGKTHYKVFKPSNTFSLQKISDRHYLIKYQSKQINVYLPIPKSDYSPIKNETLIGDMFDESGLVFALVFNKSTNDFYYILDRSNDYEFHYKLSDNVSVGARTGFVFYTRGKDIILVGVNAADVQKNTFFDGPFDQLPEYSLEKSNFKSLLIKAHPKLKGRINTHGQYIDQDNLRVAVDNYIHYNSLDVFTTLEACFKSKKEMTCLQHFINKNKYL